MCVINGSQHVGIVIMVVTQLSIFSIKVIKIINTRSLSSLLAAQKEIPQEKHTCSNREYRQCPNAQPSKEERGCFFLTLQRVFQNHCKMLPLLLFTPACLAATLQRIDLPESEYPGTFQSYQTNFFSDFFFGGFH